MSWRRMSNYFRLLCALAWLTVSSMAFASEYHGQVTLGGLPVPGATVTATQGDKKSVAVSDAQGLYSFPDLADGTWTIQVEMTGFAAIKQDVAIAPNTPTATWELKLLSLDQIRAAAKPIKVETTVAPAAVASAEIPASGTAVAPAKAAPAKGAPAKGKSDVAKPQDSNAPAASATPAAPVEDASAAPRTATSDGLLINGSVNNAATSQFALAPAFGNSRGGGKSLYTGGFTVFLNNSALDAQQFSLNGQSTPKPEFNDVTLNFSLQGPIKIPHFMPRGPNFFVNYQWTRNSNPQTLPGLVPTEDQRNGILSTGNVTPVSQATALLKLYPLPNFNGSTQYNYQVPVVRDTHQDAFNGRLDKSIGQRNQFYGGLSWQSTRASGANLFGFVDTTDSLGLSINANWSHRFKQRLFMTTGYQFSRAKNETTPYFANRINVSQAAGINGNLQDPTNWGPPSLNFSSGISGLSDANSSSNRNETNAVSVKASWNKTRHNLNFGADFRRLEFNYEAQQNPRGTFTFTGQGVGGSDIADFLLGLPDTSQIAYGNADKYFRQSSYDAYITDDWRVRPELTINAGIRWEYGAPITELYNRLVNLDVVPGFSAVAAVLASNPVGSLTGQTYPTSLVRQDKLGFQPRIGISWRPISGSSVLVKAGYGIYDDTSVYQTTASNMSQQSPLSTSLNVPTSPSCPLTLANGFLPCQSTTANTFAVDPNFRVGYAQTWQLSVQRDLPASMQMTVTYLGIKGTRGVQQYLPNTFPNGGANPCATTCPSGFVFRSSNGNSTREAGNIQLRRRLRAGFTATLQYTFSKSIDDDSFLGGQGPVSAGATSQTAGSAGNAQNWLNLNAERALSTFDQRHLLNVNLQYTTGMGLGGRALMSGWRGLAYKEWTIVTNISVGSGLPETPFYFEPLQGSTCTGCIRPNVTGKPIHVVSGASFLNLAAFSAPLPGQYGNSRRDSITGPDQFTLNASMQRSFRLHDRYSLNVRLDGTNVLNHVVFTSWNTTLNPVANPAVDQTFTPQNNPIFGLPASANAMRAITATMSLRF
jgi:hypothetical protein